MKRKFGIFVFVIAFILILLSVPLGKVSIDILYANQNLSGQYELLLNGFIHSYMLLGTLLFSLEYIILLKNK